MASRLATRTGTITPAQAASLDALGQAVRLLSITEGWSSCDTKSSPAATVRLAAMQALRSVTTYPMADKVIARFASKSGESLSQAFAFAHIGWK